MERRTLLTVIPAIFAMVWFAGGTTYFYVALSQNETGVNGTLPTGQDPIPVETPQGQVQEVAPAESIIDLFNYIIVVAVPAVLALIGTIINFVRKTGIAKKYEPQLQHLEDGMKATDAFMPKVKENIVDSGFGKLGVEIILNQLDKVKPGLKAEAETQIEQNMPTVRKKAEEAVAQMDNFREKFPKNWLADNDPNLPRPFTKPKK
jgi:hypothetical protein